MMLNPKRLTVASVLALTASLILTACNHNPPAYERPTRTYKKQPEQAAVANMQLALEYMKLGRLATGRNV